MQTEEKFLKAQLLSDPIPKAQLERKKKNWRKYKKKDGRRKGEKHEKNCY